MGGVSIMAHGVSPSGSAPFSRQRQMLTVRRSPVPFKVFFPDHSPSDFPIVQVSLPGDSSAESSIKLGLALGKLRDEGVVVVGSGQP